MAKTSTCGTCGGKGRVKVKQLKMGKTALDPHVKVNVQTQPCNSCRGTGKILRR